MSGNPLGGTAADGIEPWEKGRRAAELEHDAELARLRARVQEQDEALRAAHLGLVPNLNHPLGHCFGTAHRDFTTTWEEVEPEQRCFVCAAIYAVHGALVGGAGDTGDDEDEHTEPCIGGCGRDTNGWFEYGTHGPGWYCGWCLAVPE